MNFIYIGSSCPEKIVHERQAMGSYVNFAGHNLQEALLQGFEEHLPGFKVISSWTMTPFPKLKKLFVKRREINYAGKSGRYVYVGILNLPIINMFSEFWRVRKELKKSLKKGEDNVAFVYEVHSPFLLAVSSLRKHIQKTCLIVPDLPEYMHGHDTWLRKTLKAIDAKLIRYCLKSFDSYVLLSEPMLERLPVGDKPWELIEGVYANDLKCSDIVKEHHKTIMYSGNIGVNKGIEVLMEAFKMIDDPSYRLWIRGEGELKNEIIEWTKKDNRVTFYPPMTRQELLALERKATVLVNSTPISDFTRFFFPSKNMEYLASGTPTIMYRLGCMPKEYEDYLFYVDDNSPEALKDKIIEVCNKSQDELAAFGQKARAFILANKTPKVQCAKILDMLNRL